MTTVEPEELEMSVVSKQPYSVGDPRRNKVSPDPSDICVQHANAIMLPNELRLLYFAEQVIIKQRQEPTEFLGYEVENRYNIFNEYNQLIYMAEETSECTNANCLQNWCGTLNLVVKIKDVAGNLAVLIKCPLPLQEVCCLQSMYVWFSSGNRIGRIKQTWGYRSELHVVNGRGNTDFIINGPPRNFTWKNENVEFPIFEPDGETECGRISKRWGFLHRGLNFPESHNFGVKFPPGISTSKKALLIAAAFLVDYMYLDGKCNGGPPDKYSPFDVLHRNVILHQGPPET